MGIFAWNPYSRVRKSLDSFFSKILEKTIHSVEINDTSYERAAFSTEMKQKKIQNGRLKNSKWPPQKNLIFQLRQFSIFFHEIFMDWSLG